MPFWVTWWKASTFPQKLVSVPCKTNSSTFQCLPQLIVVLRFCFYQRSGLCPKLLLKDKKSEFNFARFLLSLSVNLNSLSWELKPKSWIFLPRLVNRFAGESIWRTTRSKTHKTENPFMIKKIMDKTLSTLIYRVKKDCLLETNNCLCEKWVLVEHKAWVYCQNKINLKN